MLERDICCMLLFACAETNASRKEQLMRQIALLLRAGRIVKTASISPKEMPRL